MNNKEMLFRLICAAVTGLCARDVVTYETIPEEAIEIARETLSKLSGD